MTIDPPTLAEIEPTVTTVVNGQEPRPFDIEYPPSLENRVDGRSHNKGQPPRMVLSLEKSWPRVMALNMVTKDMIELHRGAITRAQLCELVADFNPKVWDIQIWNHVKCSAPSEMERE
jgi:hypothetical protein